jgi:hypothetical protein
MPRLIALALLAAFAGACARVKPYQRELLSLPTMALDGNVADQHVFETREGSSGGYGSVGSGCGCN